MPAGGTQRGTHTDTNDSPHPPRRHASTNPPELLQKQYNQYTSTLEALQAKVGELQADSDEHTAVLKTLRGVEPSRKCFRMVGGVLVEKAANEVVPVLETKLAGMQQAVKQLREEFTKTTQEFELWKKASKIQVVKTR